MDKIAFTYQHTGANNTIYGVEWTGYTGDHIPDGLIVARLSKLSDTSEPSGLWTVFHWSGYIVRYEVAMSTRKLAISFAVELGKIAEDLGFSWDWTRQRLINMDKDAYLALKHERIPEILRQLT